MISTHYRNHTCKRLVLPHARRATRRQALERLYQRKAVLEALIRSLEAYARTQNQG